MNIGTFPGQNMAAYKNTILIALTSSSTLNLEALDREIAVREAELRLLKKAKIEKKKAAVPPDHEPSMKEIIDKAKESADATKSEDKPTHLKS